MHLRDITIGVAQNTLTTACGQRGPPSATTDETGLRAVLGLHLEQGNFKAAPIHLLFPKRLIGTNLCNQCILNFVQ